MVSEKPEKLSSMPLHGPTLVVGGCGMLGFHLVRHLLKETEFGSIYVVDRKSNVNVHDGATYINGNISDPATVQRVLEKIKPQIIFHTASPNPTFPLEGGAKAADKEMYDTNIAGTGNLLQSSTSIGSVKAFIFTSTVDIYASRIPHINISESSPTWTLSSGPIYGRTKSFADARVLAANDPSSDFRTMSLRTAHHYGERDTQMLPAVLDSMPGTTKRSQVGDGTNMMSVISMDNASKAHILAARCLLDPSLSTGKCDGEAFNIADAEPVLFWDQMNIIYAAATATGSPIYKYDRDPKDVRVIPAWVGLLIAFIVEWACLILTLGTVRPPASMTRGAINYCVHSHLYDGAKAEKVLGWKPEGGVETHDEVLKEAVEWEVGRRKKRWMELLEVGKRDKAMKEEQQFRKDI